MALSRLAFKKIALTVSSALLVFSAISIHAQQEFDTALNKLAPATQSVVKSLSQLDRLPAPQWRTHIADMAHGEALELDDSTWEMAHMPGQMSREAMWYRAWIEVPKDVHGYDGTGARIWFSFHVWSDGDWTKIVYFNGRRVALGEDLEPIIAFDQAKPGEWVVISGVGGLGHVAVQYAKAMGLKVAAVDIAEDKLALARETGADLAVNALATDAVDKVLTATGGGAHGVLVTAVSTAAFAQALKMVRRKGTVSLVGLPPGEFPTPIFDVVLKRITVRGSIVGTRRDLDEAIAFAADGKVKAEVTKVPLAEINDVFDRMKAGKIDGRMVLDFG